MKRKYSNKKMIALITMAAVLTACLVNMGSALAEAGDIISFADANLKQALLDAGADTSGDGEITEGELAAQEDRLDLGGCGITDLTGLEYATGISVLNLCGNQIRSLSPLLGLTGLTGLDVSSNYLDITDGSDDRADIAAIQAAGCTVVYTPQNEIPVTQVTLDKTAFALCLSETMTLTATVTPDDAANPAVTWASSNEGVAAYSGGIVTAVGIGTCTITVTAVSNGLSAGCTVTVKAAGITSDVYTVDTENGHLRGVAKLTSPVLLKENLNNDPENTMIYDAGGVELDGSHVATGMTLRYSVGGTVRQEFTIIVDGDANGDGAISITDYTLVRLHILGLKPLEGTSLVSSDVNLDSNVSISDYSLIRLDILGLKLINEDSQPYLSYIADVTDPQIYRFLSIALSQMGKPYVLGDEGPDTYDCSGLVYYCLKQAGYAGTLWRSTANSYSQWADWQRVEKADLQPGDLMFFISSDNPSRIGHVGMYLGNGNLVHASSSYGAVTVSKFQGWYSENFSHGMRVWSD